MNQSGLMTVLTEQPEKRAGSLKEQLDSITPALQEMRLRKEERLNQFRAVQGQIQKISAEIAGNSDNEPSTIVVNENDLSLKRLEEYQNELQRLYNEKVPWSHLCFLPIIEGGVPFKIVTFQIISCDFIWRMKDFSKWRNT